MEIGDIVVKKSFYYDNILFRIEDIDYKTGIYFLCGIDYRLRITSRESDLENVKLFKMLEFKRLFKKGLEHKIKNILKARNEKYEKYTDNIFSGKILHIDSDIEYLNLCKTYYKKLNINADCEKVSELEQADYIQILLQKYRPDILVITGHDSLKNKDDLLNIESYKSSKYFIETIRKARLYNPSKDSLIIIAGACQSYYEALIDAGANIASSPKRILIHALDPLFIAEKIAFSGIDEILSIETMVENTITGLDGMSGYEVRGLCRKGELNL